jgi:hypothetical protein
VNLSDWFKLEKPDTYLVTGMYRMEFFGPEFKYPPIWDDFAVSKCEVRIIGDEGK